MRKLLFFIFTWIGVLHAQNSSYIHHLYGLQETSPGTFTQNALQQQDGSFVTLETFNFNFDFSLGGEYAYRNNSNDVLYVDTTFEFASNYELPYEYTLGYSGLGVSNLVQNYFNAVCANPNDSSVLFATNLNTNSLMRVVWPGGSVVNSSNGGVDLSDIESLNQVYYNDQIIISGSNGNNTTKVYFFDASSLLLLDSLVVSAKSFYMEAHPDIGVYGIVTDLFGNNLLSYIDTQINLIVSMDTLPSCSNCTAESFLYDKNGMAIDAENNQIILSRTETTTAGTEYFLSTYDLTTGATIYDVNTAGRWSNLVFQKPEDDLVYPGDANHDKLVNMLDLLPIGLRYNDATVGRVEISNEWVGQFAINTGDSVGGVDKKHADSNGDGQINAVDIDAIILNYNNIHYSEKSIQGNCDFPLFINFPNLVKEDTIVEFQIGIDLSADAFQNIYGLVFTLEYDSTVIVPNSVSTNGVTGWFGTENTNYVQKNEDDHPRNKMDVGVVGIDKINRSGGGVLLNGIWTMEDVVIPSAQGYLDMNIRISDVTVIDFQENIIDACGVDTFVRVYDKTVGIKDRATSVLNIYPNPTKAHTINLSHIASLDYVEIYDLQGRLLNTWQQNFSNLNIESYNKGVYIVKAYANETTYVNKLIFNKE